MCCVYCKETQGILIMVIWSVSVCGLYTGTQVKISNYFLVDSLGINLYQIMDYPKTRQAYEFIQWLLSVVVGRIKCDGDRLLWNFYCCLLYTVLYTCEGLGRFIFYKILMENGLTP